MVRSSPNCPGLIQPDREYNRPFIFRWRNGTLANTFYLKFVNLLLWVDMMQRPKSNSNSDRFFAADGVVVLDGQQFSNIGQSVVIKNPKHIQLTLQNDEDFSHHGANAALLPSNDVVAIIVIDNEDKKALVGLSIENLPIVMSETFRDITSPKLSVYLVARDPNDLNEYLEKVEWHECASRLRISSNCVTVSGESGFMPTELRCDAFGDITLRYFEGGRLQEQFITNGWRGPGKS